MTSPEYIAACEIDSPNSPDFESILRLKETESLRRVKKALRAKLAEMVGNGEIGDTVFVIAYDAINQMVND